MAYVTLAEKEIISKGRPSYYILIKNCKHFFFPLAAQGPMNNSELDQECALSK